MARVDLVIPTYNGTDLLLDCLKSLQRSTFADYSLIVVDDGSNEPVDSAVRAVFPAAQVLRFEQNQGLTRVFNAAIGATGAEYVVLLNNDTEVEPDWLAELVQCADRHPAAGSIASKLRLAGDRSKIHSAGDTFSMRGMPGNRGVWIADVGQYNDEESVFGACAGAALYRRQALDTVRLPNGDWFDTRLFMYCEDVDLSWRLQTAGLPCVYCPAAVVYHHLAATGGGTLASYYVARNVWLVLANSAPANLWDTTRTRIIAHQAGRLAHNLRRLWEPAARRSVAGAMSGMWWFMTRREKRAPVDEAHWRSIVALLDER